MGKPGKRINKRDGKKRTEQKRGRKREKFPPIFTAGFWSNRIVPALLIFSVAFAIYLPAVHFDYILDDKIVISENEFTKQGLAGIWPIFSKESFEGYLGEQRNLVVGARYRPLSIATFAVEYEFFGLNPTISHLVNSLLFGLTCLLIYRILFLLFPGSRTDLKWFLSVPFFCALLFAVHPIHSEVVANIKGRDEIMAFIGALAALYCAFRYIDRQEWKWLLGSGITFFLGMMAKENAITFLAVIPFALYFFGDRPLRRIYPLIGVLFVAVVIYLVIRTSVIGYLLSGGVEVNDLMNNPFVEMNEGQKFATIFLTLGKYIQLLFVPYPLSHDYYPYAIAIQEWINPMVILSFLGYLFMAAIAVFGIRKKWNISFWIIYYMATLSIVSNLAFPVGTLMNERFIYFSSLAFCAIVPYAVLDLIPSKISSKKWIKPLGIGICIAYFLSFSWITLNRIPDWKNPTTLNASAVSANPGSARANLFYGTALFNTYRETDEVEEKNRLLNQAEHYFDKALEIHPSYSNALNMKSGVAAERYRNHRDVGRLLHEFKSVLEKKPVVSYIKEYMEYLNRTYRDKSVLLDFYYEIGYETFLKQGEVNEAYVYLQYGMELNPQDARINYGMGKLMEAIGRDQEAINYLEKAYQLDPTLRN